MPEGTQRVRISDEDFYRINEEVAASDNPTVAAVAEATGLKAGSVTQRRNLFNRTFRDKGITLTPLRRGGGAKKNVDDVAERLLAMKAELHPEQSATAADTEATPTQE